MQQPDQPSSTTRTHTTRRRRSWSIAGIGLAATGAIVLHLIGVLPPG